MKQGTQDDPFASDAPDNDDADDVAEGPTVETRDDAPETASPDVPWAVQRGSVKSEREMVQFYLREFVQAGESDFRRDVERETGYDVYTTDLREAAYLVAMNHPDEVADVLDEWGCEYA